MKRYIFAAVTWALMVLAFYFGLIAFREPFSSWSHAEQAQLFQAMVALAGFGGGLIALFFAGQQLGDRFATPKLVLRFRRRSGSAFAGGIVEDYWIQPDTVDIRIPMEVVNVEKCICANWQVVLAGPDEVVLKNPGTWNILGDGTLSYQSSMGDALYPGVPIPLGELTASIKRSAFVEKEGGEFNWRGVLAFVIVTLRGSHRQDLVLEVVYRNPQ